MPEEYVPLPLRYRPRVWKDLVGQDHAAAVLVKAIKNDRIFSTYVFAGTRGSGKTSAARIFAMSLNCENRVEDEPCLECVSCTAAITLKNPDIVEMDGASHGQIEHVRDLQQQAMYSPQFNRRVFIIDEAHALSRPAAQALLKILEEPPRHVVFILATTNPEMLPATIISRATKLDFRRHTETNVSARLEQVIELEGVQVEPEAIQLISRYADGALRDALTVLDQLLTSYEGEVITAELVANVLGVVSGTELHSIMDAVLRSEAPALEAAVDSTLARTTEFGMIVRAVTDWYRDVLRFKAGASSYVRRSDSDVALLGEFAKRMEYDQLNGAMRICWDMADKVRYSSTNPRTFFLTGLYRLMLLSYEEASPDEIPIIPPTLAASAPASYPTFEQVSASPVDLEAELAKLTGRSE